MTLQVDERRATFPFADLNRSYDLEATVDAAFAVARSGNPLVDGVTRLRTLAHPTAVTGAGVILDPAAVDRIVSDVVAAFDHPATDGSVSFRKKDGFVAAPAVEGVTVDAAALSQSLTAALDAARGRCRAGRSGGPPGSGSRHTRRPGGGHLGQLDERPAAEPDGRRASAEDSAPKLASLITFGALADGGWGASVDQEALPSCFGPSRTGWL